VFCAWHRLKPVEGELSGKVEHGESKVENAVEVIEITYSFKD
jgi:hypothetical protein